MEKKTIIKPADFNKGFFINLECAFCLEETTIAADTEKELQKKIKEEGWRNIDSKMFMLTGHWCGCDYKD